MPLTYPLWDLHTRSLYRLLQPLNQNKGDLKQDLKSMSVRKPSLDKTPRPCLCFDVLGGRYIRKREGVQTTFIDCCACANYTAAGLLTLNRGDWVLESVQMPVLCLNSLWCEAWRKRMQSGSIWYPDRASLSTSYGTLWQLYNNLCTLCCELSG